LEKKEEKPKRSLLRKIFNGVIGFFVGLIILFVLLVGFSQTYTFREFLKNKIISAFNENSQGKLSIGRIEGTLLTTLTVYDVSITVDNDTLLSSGKLKAFISPLQIFLNKVYIREFHAEDMRVALLQDDKGIWNFSKVLKAKDTTKTESFINSFQVNNIDIKNLRFIRKTNQYLNVNTDYDIINFNDLDISKININASVVGNIKDDDYALKLNNFSLQPNLKKFTIKKFSGEFFVNTKYASVKNFRIETDSSDINLTARLDSVNLFKGITLEDFKNYPAQIQLDVKSFWFDDLSSFLEATDILKGRPSLKLVADGKFGAINIRQLKLKYLNTNFDIKGSLTKLNTPEEMYIDASIQKAHINYNDVLSLLPNLKLPVFKDLVLKNTDIKFKGEPTKFNSKLTADVDEGKLNLEGYLNVKPKLMEYNVKIETDKLNLKSITGFDTELNSVSTLKGKGVRPQDLESQFNSQISNSKVQNNVVHDFKIAATGSAGNIIIDFSTAINNLRGTISGTLDFTETGNPKYNFAGKFNSLNLYQFTADSTLDCKLNFGIFAQGQKFNPDSLKTDITVNLDNSSFNNKEIPHSQLRLVVDTEDELKKIDLMSPFLDLSFTGKFSLMKADTLLTYEFQAINTAISQKLNELNPLSAVQDSEIAISEESVIPDIVKYNLDVDYTFFFKDLQPFSQLLKSSRLDLYGRGSGTIKNDASNFSISAKLLVDNFVKISLPATPPVPPIYVSDLNADIKFSRNNNTVSFNNLFGAVSITGDRFYMDKDIRNINADLTFNQSKLFFNTSAVIDSLWGAELEGKASFSSQLQEITCDRAVITNQGIEWTNQNPFYLSFAPDHFQLNGFSLKNKNASITASGQIFNVGYINGDVKCSNILINDLNKIFHLSESSFSGDLNLTAKIEGKVSAPVINTSINVNNIGYKNKKSGNLFCNLQYADKNINTNLSLLDSLSTKDNPVLSLTGNIPVDLSFGEVEKRLVDNKEIDLLFHSSRFDLSNLGDLLPLVVEQEGMLESDLKITGNIEKPNYSGFLRLKKGKFTGRINNLVYDCGLRVNFEGSDIKIDSMIVKNSSDSKYIGTTTGSGTVAFKGLLLDKIYLTMRGDLQVYGERSKVVTPSFYGDLFVSTSPNNSWTYEFNKGKSFFSGEVLLQQTNLTYTTGQDVNPAGSANDINIVYYADPKKIDPREKDFRKIIEAQNANKKEDTKTVSTFGFNISVKTKNDANIIFVFSNLADRKLTVMAQTRNLIFKSDTGAQGTLDLQAGSNLDFLKKFDAEGSVSFENNIANPNLHVTASYTNEYIPSTGDKTPLSYMVVMELNGTLDQLAVNLAKEKGKFKIYNVQGMQGKQEITRKDDNDAISFILTGKLTDDLSQNEKTDLASTLSSNVATSLLGSLLTGYLNSALGDIVRKVEFSSAGLSLGGNLFKNIRYEIGGSTQALQDFRYINLKVELQILSNFLMRYERKDPVLKNLGTDKIDELGLKLRFVF
jgi:hypothetical protein